MSEHLISDLSCALPSEALSPIPINDHWIIVPYEAEDFSGKMLWSPVRNHPPDISIELPPLGLCEIRIGIYASGTVPIWFSLATGRQLGSKAFNRLHLRLSDEDWFDLITPEDYLDLPRFTYISETLWKVANVSGKSLILSRPKKEAFEECTICVAYIRLVPTQKKETWPPETKRLYAYFDSNFCGHYVDSISDVKSHIEPLRQSDFCTIFWTTCREDSCYYPTKIGNMMPPDTMVGVYPYWAGRDMKRMLDRGEDPLRVACDVAHDCGLKLFASYRRMTCRMPPFVFPLHPNALFARRSDLWCADEEGKPVPHLSLAYPEVRQRMISLLAEQAQNYPIDGVHLFFCRGVPFVYFEKPFFQAFREEYGIDPRGLPLDDERIWKIRARFFLNLLRELRTALDQVAEEKGTRFQIAMHVMNNPRICAYYGMEIETIIRERLVDVLLPSHAHYAPKELGEWRCMPEFVAEFARMARGTGVLICPQCETHYWTDGKPVGERAAAYYEAGADGLHLSVSSGVRSEFMVTRRMGHIHELRELDPLAREAARAVRMERVAGLRLDTQCGVPTCG